MTEAAATNGAAAEAPATEAPAQPEVIYRRPEGRNISDHVRSALDAVEANGKGEAKSVAAAEAGLKAAHNPQQEGAPEDPVERQQEKISLAKQHSALTRRQRAVQEAERRAQEQVTAAEAKAQAAEAALAELEALDEMALLERVAKRKGLTLDQIVKRGIARVANKGQLPPEEATRAEIEAARKKAEEASAEVARLKEERAEETEQARDTEVKQTIDGWKHKAASLALANEDRLPLITALAPEDIGERAYDVMARYYQATKDDTGTGVVPSHEEVLLYLEQQEQADFERKEARKRKLQSPLAATEPEGADPGAVNPEQKRTARTLTNRDASERASSRKTPMTLQERIAHAAEAIPD
jgi:antitoxin component of RelBE/YafQ-DinJ toxin-antitoxin module